MHHIETSIEIMAPPAQVWQVLMDFDKYQNWNPFISHISGRPALGEKLQITIQPIGGGKMQFFPKILQIQENKELVWQGSLWIKGLFDGKHFFKLSPNPRGGTTFLHGEIFSGLLVRLFRHQLNNLVKQSFQAMNNALKTKCESVD